VLGPGKAPPSPRSGRRWWSLWHLCAVWFVSGDGVAQPGVCQFKCILPWAGRGHRDFDPSHAHADQRTDLQQLQPDRTAGCLSELGVRQPDTTQGTEQHVSHRERAAVSSRASPPRSTASPGCLLFMSVFLKSGGRSAADCQGISKSGAGFSASCGWFRVWFLLNGP
jgi:hypothetical protein